MIDLTPLKAFCAVVETGSFSAAARVVHRTQSTVSTRIAQLEEAQGVPLLERRSDRTVPTAAGRIFYDNARRILALAEETREQIGALGRTVAGDLVIGASTIPATYILPRIMGDFRRLHPGVRIILRTGNSRTVTEGIMAHAYEIGVIGGPAADNRLEACALARDRIVLVAASEHRWTRRRSVTLAEVAGEPFIVREEGSGTRAAVEAVLRARRLGPLCPVMEAGSTEAVIQAVGVRLGVALVSDLAARASGLSVIPVAGLKIERVFNLIHRRGGVMSRPVQAFIDYAASGRARVPGGADGGG
ncbi:MAG: LysR substrate-binding domain-containing protein [Planctomycetota bacterium]